MDILQFTGQIILSTILGGIIGWQREQTGKKTGMRTLALLTVGATIFTILSLEGFGIGDPARVAAQIIVGIGFIGAGTIIHKDGGIEGLTTAAALWAMTGIGMMIGVKWYWHAIISTVLIFLVLLINDRKFVKDKTDKKFDR